VAVTKIGSYIIHLARARSRRPQVEWLSKALPVESYVMAAVDGRNLSDAQMEHYVPDRLKLRYPFALRQAEIAAFLSHRNCWQAIIDNGLDAALVVEDDVILECSTFLRSFETAKKYAQQGDYIRFPLKVREVAALTVSSVGEPVLMQPYETGLGMQLQLVTRDAAALLLEKTAIFDRPVDTYLQMSWEHPSCRILSISPSGVGEISGDLGGSLIGQKQSYREKIYREVMRPIYRQRLKLRLKQGNNIEKSS
jgi:GR25 family glycosyltransferase involved in LPS biosynthesis